MVVIEMNPRVSRSSALASKATGFPIAKVAAQARRRLHARRDRQRHHRRRDAGLLRADHRLRRHQDPALRLREVPRRRADADHRDEVGRRGDGDRPHLPGIAAEGAALAGDRPDRPRRDRDRGPRQGRRQERHQGRARHADARPAAQGRPGAAPRLQPTTRSTRPARSTAGSSSSSRRSSTSRRRSSAHRPAADRPAPSGSSRPWASPTRGSPCSPARSEADVRRAAPRARRAPGLQAHRHLRRRVRLADRLHVLDLCGALRRRARRRGAAVRRARRSSSSAAGRTASARASSSTIAAATPASRCRDAGFETIMVNCNPETVSTDYDTSDRLYFEPLTAEDVLEIIDDEQPNGTLHGVIVQFGGQTPLKLAQALEEAGVPILGTSPDAIDLAEDRDRFKRLLDKLGLKQPKNGIAYSVEQARLVAADLGLPFVVRPSYVLGGRAMAIIRDEAAVRGLPARHAAEPDPVRRQGALSRTTRPGRSTRCSARTRSCSTATSRTPSRSTSTASATARTSSSPASWSTSRRRASIRATSACSLPPRSLSPETIAELERQTKALALALDVGGLMNVQYAHQGRRHLRARGQPARLAHGALRRQGHRRADRQDRRADHGGREPAPASASRRRICRISASRKRSSPSPASPASTCCSARRCARPARSSASTAPSASPSPRASSAPARKCRRTGTVFVSVRDADKAAHPAEPCGCWPSSASRSSRPAARSASSRRRRQVDEDQQGAGRPAARGRRHQERRHPARLQHHRRRRRALRTRARCAGPPSCIRCPITPL